VTANGSKAHVMIVGGGFAGLACARILGKSNDLRITLIDKNNYHQFLPLLHQLATAQIDASDVATSICQSLRHHSNQEMIKQGGGGRFINVTATPVFADGGLMQSSPGL